MPSLTWGDSGLEDAKSGPTGQRVNHQLQRVPKTVSFEDPAHPLYTHTGDFTYFAWVEVFSWHSHTKCPIHSYVEQGKKECVGVCSLYLTEQGRSAKTAK